MALILSGTRCSICDKPIYEKGPIFATTFVIFDDPVCLYSDSAMHWECYATWPHRQRFAKGYIDSWVRLERNNEFWFKVYLDDLAFITVNPYPPVKAAHVWLFKTGSRLEVPLDQWNQWIMDNAEHPTEHPVEKDALLEALPFIRASLSTVQLLLCAVDWGSKDHIHAERAAAEREKLESLVPYNERCQKIHLQLTRSGLSCPHCRKHSMNFRFLDKSPGAKCLFICQLCGRSFGPNEMEAKVQ